MCGNGGHLCPKVTHIFKNCRFYQCVSNMLGQIPVFTKSRNSVKNAMKGYREINVRGLKLVKDGGFLATCSCSHFMKEEFFVQMLHDAAKDANVSLRQIEARQQSPDHPILWNVPETYYLKFYIFQVV